MRSSSSTDMLRRLTGVVTLGVVLAGCAGTDAPTEPDGTTTSASPTAGSASPKPARHSGTAGLDRDLVADLEAVAAAHPDSEVSVALAPVGGKSRPRVVGDAEELVAWSTIKVPVSLAVLDSGQSHPQDIESALTVSDNEAAERLWMSLGESPDAARSVERELRRGGDHNTRVPGEVTSPGHSVPGQTVWRLSDQTAFTSSLPCRSGSATVTDAMGRVVEGQRWGLGQIRDARFKGGWGDTPDGYVVRQLGVLAGATGAKGETAATLQVRTGTHEQGTAIADELAGVLEDHAEDLPTGSCSGSRVRPS